MLQLLLQLAAIVGNIDGQVLVPPYTNLALGRKIEASSTCGELNGQPIKEIYCQIAGSSQYTPLNQYSYSTGEEGLSAFAEMRMEKQSFVQGGQICDFCQANSSFAHPATNMVDGRASWWQSPPLSRGMQYNQVNISIDLEQEFHVAYVWIQMANSPRPGSWVLDRSIDNGKTYIPWQYFAETPAECSRLFGRHTLQPILEDDTVICTHEFSGIHPMDNAEIMINLLENRPGKHNFSHSEVLQNFTRATNVRLRLLRTKTLHGHLMDVNRRDPTVTRRYFYAIKEIFMGGRCVCNGHADTCDILDMRRSNILLCRCEHNTCGDHCERCCPGFEQKQWQRSKEGAEFVCEPCNCNGHSEDCAYEDELDRTHASLDIHGNYEGGGRCFNCRDNTEGINCNKCSFGFYRPSGKYWNETDVCQPCRCDPTKHTGACTDETAQCECQPRFIGTECDQCAPGYYSPPECIPCDCALNGTSDRACMPVDGQCSCKPNYGGIFCDECAPKYTNLTSGCIDCNCDPTGTLNSECDDITGQCVCKANFAGLICDSCTNGYFGYPTCEYCDCDTSGTEGGICDKLTGACLCKPGFSGSRCDECDLHFWGYPHCRACGCDAMGSKLAECDQKTGECPCYANFTGKKCDRCAPGYYDYPSCKPCSCLASGSKGMTCDSNGQCYCKANFQGEQCNQCKANFYNFPICEECNCNPSGVVASFAGCDKVAPGELCTCKKHVKGRICDQCQPTYWDLQYHHEYGCVKCDCNIPGTLSALDTCSLVEGQCICKQHVAGRRCEKCADGFYRLAAHNQLGCQPCGCDVGGALSVSCDMDSGECRCRPRVTGQKCDKPIKNHYFPTLWHIKYEAEDGVSSDSRPVRFAVDNLQFPNYSWRGYAVFSTIQEDVNLDMFISKASLYRLLIHFVNPTDVNIDVKVAVAPFYTHTQDVKQTIKISLQPNTEPTTVAVNPKQPFVLNPGRWRLTMSTKQRLFLDFVVILPAEYYEGTILKEREFAPCEASNQRNETCIDLLYPPLPVVSRADAAEGAILKEIKDGGTELKLEMVPIETLPALIGEAAYVRAGNESKSIVAEVEVPENDGYIVLLEHYNPKRSTLSLSAEAYQLEKVVGNGNVALRHCPYATFCRELITSAGSPKVFYLERGKLRLILKVGPNSEFGLAALNLIKSQDWSVDHLKQIPVCIRRHGQCVEQWFPPAANAIVTEAESQQNLNSSIAGDKLPFVVSNPKETEVMPLDENMGTVEVSGVVPTRGHYVFIVQYFNPDNLPLTVGVTVQNGHIYHAQLLFNYCPSVAGCRAVLYGRDRPDVKQFFIDDKYTASFYFNESQKGPMYIDSITTVPSHSYSDSLLSPQPIDVSNDYIQTCGADNFENDPCNITDYCREKVFSLTTEYNLAALPCDCSSQGSTSFECEEYGGQCPCRPNIIGRRCDRCAPGYHSFPECIKCRCPDNHLCNEQTGQCYCPPHVEGKNCDRCVPYAFGYDPLIGCQLCGCQPNGSEGGQLQCDPNSGQCLCKANVGGRKCDRCLPGYYGFAHCYECACETKGTTDEICEATSATCKCKKNVIGESCDTCLPGTFDLRSTNPEGCAECFCFGATDRCRSSYLPVINVDIDPAAWAVTDVNGTVARADGGLEYHSSVDSMAEDVYFLVPLQGNRDYTSSYGLELSFVISSFSRSNNTKMTNSPDVQLIGNGTEMNFWAREQPLKPSKPFHVEVKLLPENFMSPSGEPASRSVLMMILHDLKAMKIKACYYTYCEKAAISDFRLEYAIDDQLNSDNTGYTASSVEVCQCPPPYSGLSCQQCAPGFYRVTTGRYLGACVPCECHGHSGSCDPDTGLCYDCQHDTTGEHCEFCREGFYGDAVSGSPYACLPCACPYPSATNNFAISCKVSETGVLEQCLCKKGYTSDHCERCDVGFYGEPMVIGGKCQRCSCNHNNDLSIDGSCHPISGVCDLCMNNTDGLHCEYCKPWYYGDAIIQKNCSECKCNQCGSSSCDYKSGHCHCYPNVEGDNCDRCVANAWGFSRCRGCDMCNCAIASISPQCHEETGQCSCMVGASGLRCEACEYGYWNYGANGCTKCDCEADLSMGTVCDVRTGQCHCQEGAVGPRCDQCAPKYLRIPTFGCRLCDECVHSLINDLDALDNSVGVVNSTINNVSTTALMGARLKRIHNNVNELRPIASDDVGTAFDLGIDNLTGSVSSAVALVAGTAIRSNWSLETLRSINAELSMIMEKTFAFAANVFDRVEVSSWVVDSVKNLVHALGRDSNAVDRQKWLADSVSLLDQIRGASNNNESAEKVINAHVKAEELLNFTKDKRQKETMVTERTRDVERRLIYLVNNVTEFKSFLDNVVERSESILQRINGTSLFDINALRDGLEKGEKDLKETLEEFERYKVKTKGLIDAVDELNGTLEAVLEKFPETFGRMSFVNRRHARNVKKEEYIHKIHQLEQEATRLSSLFGNTRVETKNAVEAANGYKELSEFLKEARSLAQNASSNAKEAKSFAEQEKATPAKKLREESASLLRSATEVQRSSINDLNGLKSKLDSKILSLKASIEQHKTNIDTMRSKFVDEDLNDKIDQSLGSSEQAKAKLEKILSNVEELQPEFDTFMKQSKDYIAVSSGFANDVGAARSQVLQLKNESMPVKEELKLLKAAAANTTMALQLCREKINSLKEKIDLARDLANRIKLGAHFEKGSSLELPLPARVTRSAAYTNLEFFFRTTSQNGLIIFFGNEVGVAGTRAVPTDDFIAVEVENGHLRVVVDLGDSPLVLFSNANVSDGNWRRVLLERVGRTIKLKISSPNSASYEEEKTGFVQGSKAVLNLHQKRSRLFVGGVVPGVKISSDVHSSEFFGDIEDLRLHGELIGLWNTKEGGSRNVKGAQKKLSSSSSSSMTDEIALSFNGDGYAVQKLGIWNPRKQTVFSLSFQTYSPDGLLLYVGKDRDFLSLELQDGALKLSFDFGSGVGKLLSSASHYNDGKPHIVYVHRLERHALLQVDGQDKAEGDSPGTMFELGVSSVYYMGGIPSNVPTRTAVVPFTGCIEHLKLDNQIVDLSKSKAAKGVHSGCTAGNVREITIFGKSTAIFDKINPSEEYELALRFKTRRAAGLLASVFAEDQELVSQIRIENGFIIAEYGADEKDLVKNELSSASDGQWHYVVFTVMPIKLRLDVDDLYFSEVDKSSDSIEGVGTPKSVQFGLIPDSTMNFEGCIGDVTYNGEQLDFAEASIKEVGMTGCSLPEDGKAAYAGAAAVTSGKPVNSDVLDSEGLPTAISESDKEFAAQNKVSVEASSPTARRGFVRKADECALLRRPFGERPDSTGTRFGLSSSSRLEFDKPPVSFDKNSIFSVQLRATASNGIIMFTTNNKHTDHLALYLVNGYVHFAYNSGSGQAILKSNRSVMDDEWHSVRAEREGVAGTLYVDDIIEANGQSPAGTDAVDTHPPFYIGGLPPDLVPFATRILPGAKAVFGGCLRDFKLNDMKFDVPPSEIGIVPCNQYIEEGLYFGQNGGYAVLNKDLKVGSSFNIELEVRPRSKTSILLSVGVLEYLTLHFVNGSVTFSVDNGAGPETVSFIPGMSNALCDGHWHHIKLYKTKNLMTLTVDGKSTLHIMKKGKKTDTNTKDPLYLGGLPKGIRPKSLGGIDGYVGCIRVINMGKKPRKRKNIDISHVPLFGDVARNQCPVN